MPVATIDVRGIYGTNFSAWGQGGRDSIHLASTENPLLILYLREVKPDIENYFRRWISSWAHVDLFDGYSSKQKNNP